MTPYRARRLAAGLLIAGLTCVVQAQPQVVHLDDASATVFPIAWTVDTSDVQSVSVMLDGYDITALTTITWEHVTLSPELALAPGLHQVEVYAQLSNGELLPIMQRQLDVFQRPGLRSASLALNGLLSSSYRVDQKEPENFQGADHSYSQGGMQLRAQRQTEHWQFDAEVDALYDQIPENHASDDEWALPHYRLAATRQFANGGQGGVAAGTLGVAASNLLFEHYYRRGVEAYAETAGQRVKLQAFAVNSEPTVSIHSGLVSGSDSSERAAGGQASFAVFADNPDWLQLSAGYIDGETTLGGAAVSALDEVLVYGGSSWNTALDSWWFQRSLWWHLEYAESEFDADGIGVGEDEQSDHAWQGVLQLSSQGGWQLPLLDSWLLGYQQQWVGAQYYSLGNLYLPGDIERRRVYAQALRGGLTLDLDWLEDQSDVDDDPLRAAIQQERSSVSASYAPSVNPEQGLWSFLGTPVFNGYVVSMDRSQPRADTVLGFDTDETTDEYSVGVNFSRETWGWGLQHTQTAFDDKTASLDQGGFVVYEPRSDSDNALTVLQLTYMPSHRFSVSPLLQWNALEEDDSGITYRNFFVGINGYVELIPEVLRLTVNYSLNQDESDYDPVFEYEQDLQSQTGQFDLNWTALAAKGWRPGVHAFLRGSYGRQHDRWLEDAQEIWQVLVGVELHWAKEN